MARPKKPLRERIECRCHRAGGHLIWNGHMRGDLPHLARVGNPARILLDLTEHPDYQIRRDRHVCDQPRCIDPFHYRVIPEKRFKYGDLPNTPWRDPRDPNNQRFTDRELIEVKEGLELFRANELSLEDLETYPRHVRDEIMARAAF